MPISYEDPLPTPTELKSELPAFDSDKKFIQQTREQIRGVLNGLDDRLLLICGPCSIHDQAAAREYASKLKKLSEEVEDTFLVIMRSYFEKPRTAKGWKGLLHDPFLDSTHNTAIGMRWTRQLLLDLAQQRVPAAAEFLDPISPTYFSDLISWGCIGARTSSSQTHRLIASALEMPVGIKNTTQGCVETCVNGVLVATIPHTYVGLNDEGKLQPIRTKGNSEAHVILRGGKNHTNYDPDSIEKTLVLLDDAHLPQRVLIDCSHDNCQKKHELQPQVFQSVINQVIEGNSNIRGLLLESNLFEGNQAFMSDHSKLRYGVSVTDPCLDWATTEKLIFWARSRLKKYNKHEAISCNP